MKEYNHNDIEDKWYAKWIEQHFFRSVPDGRKAYTIVMPPPNITGILHMGHMLNNTIQDILIRRARMKGFNACWVPGTDHASIATESKVVALLAEKGISKKDISREEFLKHAWEWKSKYGGIILEQLKKLGCSCDWDRTSFTMDESLSEAVTQVFIDLYNDGLIYRGHRMVNWDPLGMTALSDEEVEYKEAMSKMYHIKYQIEGEDQWITVATTRPETMFGDTAVCVNPEDARYNSFQAKRCIVPLTGRSIPIICDDYVDMEFGTGALKITPAHDANDNLLGVQHGLDVIEVIGPDGKMTEVTGKYAGLDRFEARRRIVKDLEEGGYLLKTEEVKNKIGYSQRTKAVVEPRISLQWFLKMDKLAVRGISSVNDGTIEFVPEKFIGSYNNWMNNIHDWCISRQLWWGHRIPAWHAEDGTTVVAKTREEAITLLQSKNPHLNIETLKQDDDVLDTWFSSWLWPMSVFEGIKNDAGELGYYYPTDVLVTGHDIMFFWVARMIMAGYEYTSMPPFKEVYFTGMVRDEKGQRMEKSKGNSPDPIELMKQYGADGTRYGLMLNSPAGNDLIFKNEFCEHGRMFANKIWNACKLVKSWTPDYNTKPSETNQWVVEHFSEKLHSELKGIEDLFDKHKLSEALSASSILFKEDFCSWYLEMIKPERSPDFIKTIDGHTYDATLYFFETILKTLHPFMPFVTEEVWHNLRSREEVECIIVSSWPTIREAESNAVEAWDKTKEITTFVRNSNSKHGIKGQDFTQVIRYSKEENDKEDGLRTMLQVAKKIVNITSIQKCFQLPTGRYEIMTAWGIEIMVPIPDRPDSTVDSSKELERLKSELAKTEAKLSNDGFIKNAKPELIDREKAKFRDFSERISAIEQTVF